MKVSAIEVVAPTGRVLRLIHDHELTDLGWDELENLLKGIDSVRSYSLSLQGPGFSQVDIEGIDGRFVVSGVFIEIGPVECVLSDGPLSTETQILEALEPPIEVPSSCFVSSSLMVEAARLFCETGRPHPAFVRR